jgi:hypothetical protein
MERPKQFIMTKPEEKKPVVKEGFKMPWGTISRAILIGLFIGAVGFYAFCKCNAIYTQIKTNWSEIKFAYEKPEIVKAIRESYQKKQAALDASFKEEKKTAEQQLLEAVAAKVQETPKK